MTVRARLFDADGHDRDVTIGRDPIPKPGQRRLLWIDLDERTERDLRASAEALGIERALFDRLVEPVPRARLRIHEHHIHCALVTAADPVSGDEPDPFRPAGLDVVVGPDWVMTVHDGPSAPVRDALATFEGDSRIGALDAADLMAGIVDSMVVGYLRIVEALEQEVDRLDEIALRGDPHDDVLESIVQLRRRIADLRRALAPHREAFAPLGRPDLELPEGIGTPWPALLDRLERGLDAVERTRDALIGTYDIHMGRVAQRANEVMKTLTIVSAVLLPAIVLAGIMGMNFPLPFFETPANFGLVVAAMVLCAIAILAVTRWRRWI